MEVWSHGYCLWTSGLTVPYLALRLDTGTEYFLAMDGREYLVVDSVQVPLGTLPLHQLTPLYLRRSDYFTDRLFAPK